MVVKALEDAGLIVTPLDGSAFAFKNEKGKVVLHRPHVNQKILRRYGESLSLHFGWDIDTFVLRTKDHTESGRYQVSTQSYSFASFTRAASGDINDGDSDTTGDLGN